MVESKKRLTDENAVVAELAYAHDSGSCPRKWVRVQVPSTALNRTGNVGNNVSGYFFVLITNNQRIKPAKHILFREGDEKNEPCPQTEIYNIRW